MKVIIKETNVEESLEFIDPRTGLNWVDDFIGNTGALSDGQFVWDEDKDAYACEQETFDWWEKVTQENEALEYRLLELSKEFGSEAVYLVVDNSGSGDLEDRASNINSALDDEFNV